MGTILDLNSDKAEMFGSPVELQFTSTGHYCIDITNTSVLKVLIVNGNMNDSSKVKMLTKLHQQFGYASAEEPKQLLKSAGTDNSDILGRSS